MQSVRTLYEEGYIEDSWIGQWGKENLPMLPKEQSLLLLSTTSAVRI